MTKGNSRQSTGIHWGDGHQPGTPVGAGVAVTDGDAFVVSGVVGTGFLDSLGASPVGASGATVPVSEGSADAGEDDGAELGAEPAGDEVLEDGASVLLSVLHAAMRAVAPIAAAMAVAVVA